MVRPSALEQLVPATAAALAVGVDGTVLAASAAAAQLLTDQPGQLTGRAAAELVAGVDRSRLLDQLAVPDRPQRYRVGQRWLEVEVEDRTADPRIEALVLRWRDVGELTALADALAASEERYRSLVESLAEAGSPTDCEEQPEQVAHRAHQDPLTGLLDRTAVFGELERALDGLPVDGGPLLAVLFLDLDDFERVNERLGHEAGGTVLELAARRLSRLVRTEDRVGRVGGDEFVVVSPGHPDAERAVALAQRLVASIATPFDVGGTRIVVSASAGIALERAATSAVPARRPAELVRAAHAAMARARTRGGSDVQVAARLAVVAASS